MALYAVKCVLVTTTSASEHAFCPSAQFDSGRFAQQRGDHLFGLRADFFFLHFFDHCAKVLHVQDAIAFFHLGRVFIVVQVIVHITHVLVTLTLVIFAITGVFSPSRLECLLFIVFSSQQYSGATRVACKIEKALSSSLATLLKLSSYNELPRPHTE
ncbi:hypothetical protein BpHYR1_031539 [Brachionus plicatilis]|uniref:Uncharacterized protein n=1 Tax=Brachionus plicatilis TaxID=10195 RepID=A0A3M7PY98_BRAPC|nr:hypothetical protein BpHYR1_031539 [Brachionus plicatilis]